jgi:hypothetical protein
MAYSRHSPHKSCTVLTSQREVLVSRFVCQNVSQLHISGEEKENCESSEGIEPEGLK